MHLKSEIRLRNGFRGIPTKQMTPHQRLIGPSYPSPVRLAEVIMKLAVFFLCLSKTIIRAPVAGCAWPPLQSDHRLPVRWEAACEAALLYAHNQLAAPVVSLSSCWSWVIWKDESTYRFASVHTKLKLLLYREWRREWDSWKSPCETPQSTLLLLLPRFYLDLRHLQLTCSQLCSAGTRSHYILLCFRYRTVMIHSVPRGGEWKVLWSIRMDRGWRQFSPQKSLHVCLILGNLSCIHSPS